MASFASSFVATDVAGAFGTAACRHRRSGNIAIVSKVSRIGKLPVQIPDKVKVTIDGRNVTVKGPKGELFRVMPPMVTLQQEDNKITVGMKDNSRKANEQHGLSRTLVNNMVVGVTTGYSKTLTMIGVGYRAQVSGKMLTLSLGYSHPVEMKIPEGIDVAVEKNTTVVVSGYDKEQVGQFAADVRSKREPEPYKGKGVRYADEYVARKEGKRGK